MKKFNWLAALGAGVAVWIVFVITPAVNRTTLPATRVYAQNLAQDPCSSSQITKLSKSVAITTATTTSVLPVSSPYGYFVCGFTLVSSASSTANTVQFEYGTSTNCTGTNALTGVASLGATTTVWTYGGGGQTIFSVPQNNGLCIVSTVGSTPTIEGVVTYVAQ